MQPPPGLSPDDVAYLVNLHSGLIGVPVALHAALCSKLVNGVLDAGASFYIEENEESRRQTHALVELSVEGDVWICEHAASFSTREELLHLVRQEGDVINDSGENSAAARPLHAVAALAPEAGAAAVTDALLHGHSHLLPAASGGDAGSHFICSDFAGAFGAADLSTAPSCCSVAIFSPLHGRHFSVVWVTTALKQNEACTVRRDDGCYFPNAKGGNAHLHRVSSPHYRTLFHLDRGSVKPVAANTTQLTNLSPDPLRPVLLCADFLQPHELEYLRGLVYDGEEGSFGTQFIKGVATTKEAAPPSSEKVHDPELAHELDADTMALVAAVLGERNPAGSSGESGATKNRLRTSHFLRTVWWRSDQGRLIFEAISARAGALLGLPAACAEAPQMVCYPGGLSYFRPHHDSGRLLDDDQQDYSCSEAGSSSSDNESSGTESSSRGAWVNLDRDQHGAARVATVFVYLSSHEPGSGGSTTFSRLQQPTDAAAETTAAKEAAAAAATLVDALKVALVAAKDANSTATAAMLVTGTHCGLSPVVHRALTFCVVPPQHWPRERQKLLAPHDCLSSR